MAKVLYGAIVVGLRGSVGGGVFSKNGAGNTYGVKTTAKKAKPKSMFQASRIGASARNWRNLTEIERGQFKTYAETQPRKNSLGVDYNLNGLQMFSSLSGNLTSVGLPALTGFLNPFDPDNSVNDVIFNSIGISLASGIGVAATNVLGNGFTSFKLFASRPLSQGKSTPNGNYKLLGTYNFTLGLVFIGLSDYEDIYGALSIGQCVFFKMVAYNTNSGLQVNLTDNYKVIVDA